MRKIQSLLTLVLALLLSSVSFAQTDLTASLPFDSKVKKGTLPNGVTYYVRENKKPEKKVELRLVIKVGSIVEDDDQQGLAHMCEHMAFNGTKNFKKNDIVSYLQSIGVQFGGDLNAYTSFDETVYILPIPTDQPGNLEKGFQVLEDWAHNVTYYNDDIDGERPIILEESRLGKSAGERMFKKVYPELFKGSKYAQRLPIGVDSLIQHFPYDAIKRYYRDWYRPDLMSVVVVGDISQAEALKYIEQHFGGIPSVANGRKREYANVPAYAENKAMVVTDKEATSIQFSINYSAHPKTASTTVGDYRNDLVQNLYSSMLNARFREISQKADPPFVFASADFSSYAKFYEAFSLSGSTGTQDVVKGIEAVATEIERVKRFGFTEPELERAKKNMLSTYERLWNNRDKTESESYTDEYVNNFTDGEPSPGIDAEFGYVKSLLPGISIKEVNAITDSYKNETNRFSFVMGPEAGTAAKLPSADAVVAILDSKAKDNTIKAYEEKAVASSLLTKMPTPGKVVSTKKNAVLGTTELVLSNGIAVTLKQTDFKNDQILFSLQRDGGLSSYGLADKYSVENATALVAAMGVGQFSPTDLRKALAGKSVSVSPNIGNYSAGIGGNSSKKDIETLFQLLNLYVNEPRKDTALFRSLIQKQKSQVAMIGANPQAAFIDTLMKVMYNNNPLAPTAVPKAENYDKIDLDRALAIYKERLGDLGGAKIVIVGSFDEKEITALLEKYVAGLNAKTKGVVVDNKVREAKGVNDFQFKKGTANKSLILGILHGEIPYSPATSLQLDGLSDALNIIITEEMREKIQGIYGGGTSAQLSKTPVGSFQFMLQLPCGPEKVDTLIAAFRQELKEIAEKGIDTGYVSKVKKAWIESNKDDMKKNEYWLSGLVSINKGETTEDRFVNANKYYNAFTGEDIKKAAKIVMAATGKIMAVQLPAAKKEEEKPAEPKKGF